MGWGTGDAQDRAIRVLMSLAEDLHVERDEAGLLQSMLTHVVENLVLRGGVTFVLDDGRRPRARGRGQRDARRRPTPALEAAREAVEGDRPVVRELPDAGWLAATPLGAADAWSGRWCCTAPTSRIRRPTPTCSRPWADRSEPGSRTCASSRSCARRRTRTEILSA